MFTFIGHKIQPFFLIGWDWNKMGLGVLRNYFILNQFSLELEHLQVFQEMINVARTIIKTFGGFETRRGHLRIINVFVFDVHSWLYLLI